MGEGGPRKRWMRSGIRREGRPLPYGDEGKWGGRGDPSPTKETPLRSPSPTEMGERGALDLSPYRKIEQRCSAG